MARTRIRVILILAFICSPFTTLLCTGAWFTSCLWVAWGATATENVVQGSEMGITHEEPEVSLKPEVEYTAEGLRDPFKSYIMPERLSQAEGQELGAAEQPLPALLVQGIVWGGKFPQAIINNKITKIGDEIEGAKILEISKDGVVVFYNNRRYNLSPPATTGLESLKQKPEGG